jgi:hypothetical protein
MIGSAGYLMAMENTGVLDCTMYLAGKIQKQQYGTLQL